MSWSPLLSQPLKERTYIIRLRIRVSSQARRFVQSGASAAPPREGTVASLLVVALLRLFVKVSKSRLVAWGGAPCTYWRICAASSVRWRARKSVMESCCCHWFDSTNDLISGHVLAGEA